MSGKDLQIGDRAYTHYNGNRPTLVRIIARSENQVSQTGIMFQVSPTLKNGSKDSWYDSAWFTPEV